MTDDLLRYDQMVDEALRGVMRRALQQAAESGLPGDHHFYVSFATHMDGVQIPDYLRAQYPSDMTIVLQHQYRDLSLDDTAFAVTLSFSGRDERLVIPFDAVTGFTDPSVKFGLQFQAPEPPAGSPLLLSGSGGEAKPASEHASETAGTEGAEEAPRTTGEVVSIDQFRRRTGRGDPSPSSGE